MRSTFKYLALLALVAAFFDWKLVFTHQFTMLMVQEDVSYVYSWLHFWIHSLRSGHLPLWDPYGFCGHPFAGEMLPSAFYPLHLLWLLVPFNKAGSLSPQAYNLIYVIARLICLWFTFALIRELGLSRVSAFVGACSFTLGGLMGSMPWTTFLEAGGWLPLIFLFLLRALRAPGFGGAVRQASISGLCMGMSILTGGLHFCIMQGIFVLSAVLYCGFSGSFSVGLTPPVHRRRIALIFATFVAVAAAAGAIQLLPEFEYAHLSLRYIDGGPWPSNEKIPYHRLHPGMWPQSILTVLIPTAFGKVGGGEAWSSYIGVLPFFLALVAVWKCWRKVWVPFMAGLAVVSFIYTLREFAPLHGWLYGVVPYLWTIRAPARFVYLVCFALSILAAYGLEYMLHEAGAGEDWARALVIVKWLAISCAVALFVPGVFTQVTLSIWTAASLLLILASCGWFYYLTVKPARAGTLFLLAVFVFFDLSTFHWGAADRDAPEKPEETYKQMVSLQGVAEFVKKQPELARVNLGFFPQPNLGDMYGVQAIAGGGGTLLNSYAWFTSKRPELLNGRYLIAPASATQPSPIYQDEHWKLYLDSAAFPRAWFVHQAKIEPSQEAAFKRLEDHTIDFHKIAFLETPLPEPLAPAATTIEKAQFTSYEPNRIALNVVTGGTSLLVLSEMHYPGWRASVNGKAAPILRVDGGLRGIVVPGGSGRVELRYVPVRVYVGGVLTLLAFGGVLTVVGLDWYQRKYRRRRSTRELANAAL